MSWRRRITAVAAGRGGQLQEEESGEEEEKEEEGITARGGGELQHYNGSKYGYMSLSRPANGRLLVFTPSYITCSIFFIFFILL